MYVCDCQCEPNIPSVTWLTLAFQISKMCHLLSYANWCFAIVDPAFHKSRSLFYAFICFSVCVHQSVAWQAFFLSSVPPLFLFPSLKKKKKFQPHTHKHTDTHTPHTSSVISILLHVHTLLFLLFLGCCFLHSGGEEHGNLQTVNVKCKKKSLLAMKLKKKCVLGWSNLILRIAVQPHS